MEEKKVIKIPYDMYESPQELLIVMPLGGVDKNSLEITIEDYKLVIQGKRPHVDVKDNFVTLQEDCYRGPIRREIDLPPQVYFDKIHSKLTSENILHIIVPKSIIPEKIALEVEYDEA